MRLLRAVLSDQFDLDCIVLALVRTVAIVPLFPTLLVEVWCGGIGHIDEVAVYIMLG